MGDPEGLVGPVEDHQTGIVKYQSCPSCGFFCRAVITGKNSHFLPPWINYQCKYPVILTWIHSYFLLSIRLLMFLIKLSLGNEMPSLDSTLRIHNGCLEVAPAVDSYVMGYVSQKLEPEFVGFL